MCDTLTGNCFQEPVQARAPFYGAVKSKNEIYFQIASVFKAVTQDETRLTREWTHRILISRLPENTGKVYVNGL